MTDHTKEELKYAAIIITILSTMALIIYLLQYEPRFKPLAKVQTDIRSDTTIQTTTIAPEVQKIFDEEKYYYTMSIWDNMLGLYAYFSIFSIAALYVRYIGRLAVFLYGGHWLRVVFLIVIVFVGFRFASIINEFEIAFFAIICWFISIFLTDYVFEYTVDHLETERFKADIMDAYGNKDWASKEEIKQRFKNSPNGIHIGGGWHWNEKGHMLLVGGSGQGKGVNLILPALLSNGLVNAGISVIVLDPKGENAAITVPHLKRSGYDVHVMNPFGIPEIADLGNSCFNPFDMINPESDDASKLCDALAAALHNRRGTGDNSFFDNRCRQYISIYLHYALHTGQTDFATVYKWLLFTDDKRKELLVGMAADDTFERAINAEGILSRLTGESLKTEENIFGTIEEAIDILKSRSIKRSLSNSDFDMRQIAHKPTAIFICVPFEDLEDYAPWVRMIFNFLMRTLTRHYNLERKVLLLLDEFPQLGYMQEFEKSAAVLRGYNVTIWPVVQGLGQLKKLYKDSWELFMSSAIIKHWLSMQTDNTTADYISKRMPDTVRFASHPNGSPREIVRKLLNTDEVITFSDIICEISGLASPVHFRKMPYYEPPFSDNASPNPFN